MTTVIQLYNYIKPLLTSSKPVDIFTVYQRILHFDGYLLQNRPELQYYQPILHHLKEAERAHDLASFTTGLDDLVKAIEKRNGVHHLK